MIPPNGCRVALLGALLMAAGLPQAVLAQDPSAPGQPGASAGPMSQAPTSPAAGGPIALADIERGSALEPGRYVDRSVGRDISFDLEQGWIHEGAIDGAGLALVRDGPGAPYLYIGHFPGQVFPAGCATEDEAQRAAFIEGLVSIEPTAAAFIEHIAAHPAITATEPVPVEIAGYSGLQLDVSGVDVDESCVPPWAWLWSLPVVGDYHLAEGVVARIVAFDADGQVIVVVMEMLPDGDLAAFTEQGANLLATLELGPPAS